MTSEIANGGDDAPDAVSTGGAVTSGPPPAPRAAPAKAPVAPPVGNPDLTLKQQLFCREYALHGVGVRAAIAAGYSPHTAKVIASENLTKPYLAEEIARLREEYAEHFEVSAERVLREYAQIAFADRGALTLKGMLKSGNALPVGLSACIEGVEETDSGLKYKLAPKTKALEALSKHLGLFEADNKQQGAAAAETEAVGDLEFARRLAWLLQSGAKVNQSQEQT